MIIRMEFNSNQTNMALNKLSLMSAIPRCKYHIKILNFKGVLVFQISLSTGNYTMEKEEKNGCNMQIGPF
jgi:hypothetical protein